ncbi:cysteine-rich DPF motif domain-containing protein 1 isoform X2 [Tupaia chinensis]|uniref:cysteine-rich DPF motif domain-containing protein 1 isoform X2 n=1 Tax=Tupaia chinensis TaxID=246437 RepID=UPI00070401B0|nr:cysteine-rich DPF motif domain-containing protein 1 isoform X2 [Tupaia chinensis]
MECRGQRHPYRATEPVQMALEAERHALGVFECQLCALTAPYSYKGQKPPNTQSVVRLLEGWPACCSRGTLGQWQAASLCCPGAWCGSALWSDPDAQWGAACPQGCVVGEVPVLPVGKEGSGVEGRPRSPTPVSQVRSGSPPLLSPAAGLVLGRAWPSHHYPAAWLDTREALWMCHPEMSMLPLHGQHCCGGVP